MFIAAQGLVSSSPVKGLTANQLPAFYSQPLRRFREGDVSCQEGLELESRKAVFSTARKYGILTGENCGINFAPLFFGIFILFWDVLELIYNI